MLADQASTATAQSSLDFDGVNDHVVIPHSTSLSPTTQVTIEAWIWIDSVTGSEHGLLAKWDDIGGNKRSYGLFLLNSRFDFIISHDGGIPGFARTTDPQVAGTGQWYHVAGVFDGTGLFLYKNGLLASSSISPGPISQQAVPLKIGQTDTGGNSPDEHDGRIDEVRVWNVARTALQIQSKLSCSLSGHEYGLVGYWRFDEGMGTQVFDASGNANNGTLVNGTIWHPSNAPISPFKRCAVLIPPIPPALPPIAWPWIPIIAGPTRYLQALVIYPDRDFDGDGVPNRQELQPGRSPFESH